MPAEPRQHLAEQARQRQQQALHRGHHTLTEWELGFGDQPVEPAADRVRYQGCSLRKNRSPSFPQITHVIHPARWTVRRFDAVGYHVWTTWTTLRNWVRDGAFVALLSRLLHVEAYCTCHDQPGGEEASQPGRNFGPPHPIGATTTGTYRVGHGSAAAQRRSDGRRHPARGGPASHEGAGGSRHAPSPGAPGTPRPGAGTPSMSSHWRPTRGGHVETRRCDRRGMAAATASAAA
jgi:hypothetical protein